MSKAIHDAAAFDEIFRITLAIIVEALRIDPASVTPESNLVLDLNAESIDMVDIRFRVEERFGFKVDQQAFLSGIAPGDLTSQVERLTMRRLVAFIMLQMSERGAER